MSLPLSSTRLDFSRLTGHCGCFQRRSSILSRWNRRRRLRDPAASTASASAAAAATRHLCGWVLVPTHCGGVRGSRPGGRARCWWAWVFDGRRLAVQGLLHLHLWVICWNGVVWDWWDGHGDDSGGRPAQDPIVLRRMHHPRGLLHPEYLLVLRRAREANSKHRGSWRGMLDLRRGRAAAATTITTVTAVHLRRGLLHLGGMLLRKRPRQDRFFLRHRLFLFFVRSSCRRSGIHSPRTELRGRIKHHTLCRKECIGMRNALQRIV